ncbi:hypothetical protein ABNT96_27215 [Klebsiella pneumoniae]
MLHRVQPEISWLCTSWLRVALSSSRCVTDAKTVAVSLTDLPGLSTSRGRF